ncbi:substrate-binding periplasmic protein [Fervidobacterium gondwanense]|uniref:substrate-binding periplasmic protein n=1 Tax=Fervidobacterium gondwanense TaxID=44754 RepID=UPI003C7119A6
MRDYRKIMKSITILIVVLHSIVLLAKSNLILYTYPQDAAPKYILQENSISGFCHDIIVELNKELKSENIEIGYKSNSLKSISEIFDALSRGEIQTFVGAAYSDERDAKYLRLPVYGLREMFLIRADREDVIRGKDTLRIGVIGGTVTSEKVPRISTHVEVISYKSITSALNSLDNGQIDAVFYSNLILGYYLTQSKGKYKIFSATSEKYYHYIVFSKSVDESVIKIFEKAVRRLMTKDVINRIIKKYNLEGYVLPGNVVEILTIDWMPYEWYDKSKKEWIGIDVDVVKRVFQDLGFQVIFHTFPWTRCIQLMKDKSYDGIMSLRISDERKDFLTFPNEPLSTGLDVLFKLKSSNIDLSLLEKIPKNLICGYTDGYAYGDWFWNAEFRKVPVSTDEVGFELLKSGRIDLFVCNLLVGKYIAQGMKLEVDYSPIFGEKMVYYIGFSKNFHGAFLAESFSEQLKRFKNTPDYKGILRKYGVKYEELWK